MKAIWLIKDRRGRRGAPRLSLFPFLAVLICTMGALMLLLLFVTRQARLQAAKDAVAKDAEKRSSITAEMEMVHWRVEQLKKSRQETEAQLGDARLVLGHIEDHGRRLRDRFQELSGQVKKAANEGLKPGRFAAAGQDELRQVEGQIAEAQQQLVQAQQVAANRPKSYAIVPYDGPNRTRRRPIYIECRGDAVVLQPENIEFKEADFDEPLGPGNPLAAAIRAAREQMLLQGNVDPQNAGEPYPLLLVRPAGIAAYDAALAAMKSWGSEFGYELINEDWQLKYPPPNPNLAKAVAQAIFLARQEHARLIAAAPSKYGKRPRLGSYRSPTGDDAGEQSRAGDAESPGFYASKPADRYARAASGDGSSGAARSGHGGGGFGSGGTSNGSGGGQGDAVDSDAEFAANNPYASLPTPGMTGPPTMLPGGMGAGAGIGYGSGSGYGTGNGMGYGIGSGTGNGLGGAAGSGVSGGMAGAPTMLPGGMAAGTGSGYGTGNGSGYGTGSGMGGTPGSGVAGGMAGSPIMLPGGMAAGTGARSGTGNASAYGTGSGMGGTLGSGVAGGPAGSTSTNAAGVASNYATSGNQPAMQFTGQPANGSAAAAGVARPDGYINGRPNDGTPPSIRTDPSSSMAMAPAAPLLPGEWRPSQETNPPKRDRDEEEKEKEKEKKKHPYDKVKIDHDQNDWALRNATRHAAAISRPIHVDCYLDRIVLVPEANSGEPRVILCDSGRQRDADKLVAAVWEIMDTWGMAGREMYWRPVLNFYVAPGAEPRMLDLVRSLEGSGLVIERKQ